MNLEERIQVFTQLGTYLKDQFYIENSEKLKQVEARNPWFIQKNIENAISIWAEQLNSEMLRAWLNPYSLADTIHSKKVLIIMAGNIPLVGFHDFLSVIVVGHKAVVKTSSSDDVLTPLLIEKLINIAPNLQEYIEFIDDVTDKQFDAVIATGSDNSAQYFEYYFKDIKKVIRKNRISVALLDGTETERELDGLANDIFSYFGLGCRNVSKLFLPKGYDLNKLFKVFYPYRDVLKHRKYRNNYDHNKTVFLMGKNQLIENGFLLLKEDKSSFSPVAMLYYEYYDDMHSAVQYIEENQKKIQCVVSKKDIPFGCSQRPNLWHYADGVDTVNFLQKL